MPGNVPTTKSPFHSKTLWANFILAVAAFFPQVSTVLTPDAMVYVILGINFILRLVTKDKLQLS